MTALFLSLVFAASPADHQAAAALALSQSPEPIAAPQSPMPPAAPAGVPAVCPTGTCGVATYAPVTAYATTSSCSTGSQRVRFRERRGGRIFFRGRIRGGGCSSCGG